MIMSLIKKMPLFRKLAKIKDLFFEKFDAILGKLQTQDTALASLAANDTSTLQTLVHLVERSQEIATAQHNVEKSLAEVERMLNEQRAKVLSPRTSATEGRFRECIVQTRAGGLLSPDVALMAHLGAYLPKRTALDIGANVGDVAEELLAAGFTVHAFEPNPPVVDKLKSRLECYPGFAFQVVAIGAEDGTMDLHLASDISPQRYYGEDGSIYSTLTRHNLPPELQYTSSIPVPVRSLASLHESREIPSDVSLVKIDTEGFDLEVIRGMGEHVYPVVVAEFWDEAMVFGGAGTHNDLRSLAREMRRRGSPWFIVIARLFPSDEEAFFYCNLPASLESSWGNVFFFRDEELFERARRWCGTTLPEASFRKSFATPN